MTGTDVATTAKAEPITESDKAYGRTTTRIQVAAAVWTLWDRLRKEQGLDQQWLADRMGKSKSRVSRLLKGPGNWTLDTVGDLLEAMHGRLTCVEAHTYQEIAEGKAWKAALKERPGRVAYVKVQMEMLVTDEADSAELEHLSPEVAQLPTARPLSLPLIKQVEAA